MTNKSLADILSPTERSRFENWLFYCSGVDERDIDHLIDANRADEPEAFGRALNALRAFRQWVRDKTQSENS